jgi:glycosyltransferase involved in cell wall biosynthesis
MKTDMDVSVVIAVYKAEKYIGFAIESALRQPEMKQLVIVEDCSPDRSLEICREYASRDQRILVLQHPDRQNHGAGASFNLGIKHATCEYVAILGADDQYVENGLSQLSKILKAHPDAQGAYGHLGVIYYDPEYKPMHLKRIPTEISGMKQPVRPEELLTSLLRAINGHISLDTLVMKRDILTDQFLFDESLRLAQDTDFIYRLSSAYRLYGAIEQTIVALRGVHGGNRVFRFDDVAIYRQKLFAKCIDNNFYGCKDRDTIKAVIRRYIHACLASRKSRIPVRMRRKLTKLGFILMHPGLARYVV